MCISNRNEKIMFCNQIIIFNNYLNIQVYFFFLLQLFFFFVLCNNIRNFYVKIKMVLWFICFFFFL